MLPRKAGLRSDEDSGRFGQEGEAVDMQALPPALLSSVQFIVLFVHILADALLR